MTEENDSLVEKLKKELEELDKEEKLLLAKEETLKNQEKTFSQTTQPTSETNTVPVEESPKPKQELIEGGTYLIMEETPMRSIEIYEEKVEEGYTGLFISRVNPPQMKKKHPNIKGEIYWLTTVKSTEQPSISGLQELSILVSNFIDTNQKTMILLDGLEYLISNNDYSIVLRLVQQVRDKVSTSESVLLIPLNSSALETKELTLLKRECLPIE